MSKTNLPDELANKIENDAQAIAGKEFSYFKFTREHNAYESGYIAGATEYAIWKVAFEGKERELQKSQQATEHFRNHYDKLGAKYREMLDLLDEARLQIEYLQGKFLETGSGNNVLSRINTFLNDK